MIRVFNQYVSAKSFLLMAVEALLIVLSLICAVKLRFWNNPTEALFYLALPDFAVQAAIVVFVCVACFYYNDLYDVSTGDSAVERVLRVEQSLGAASLLLGLLYFMFPSLLLGRGVFIIGMALVTAVVILSRKLLDKAWQLTAPIQRVVILGTGQLALELARELTRRGDLSMKLEGFVGGAGSRDEKIFGFPVLGPTSEMEAIAKERAVSRIIVAHEEHRGTLPTRELVTLRVQGARVEDAASALSGLRERVSLRALKPSWRVFSEGFHRPHCIDLLKRALG